MTTPTLSGFVKLGPKGPPHATAWDALKAIGLELVAIIVLTVVAGTGSTGADLALGFLLVLWLLAIMAPAPK